MRHYALLILLSWLMACSQPQSASDAATEPTAKPSVTTTTIRTEPMTAYRMLNATSSYLKKETIQAPIAGYIRQNDVIIGKRVARGSTLFTIQTKEASALQFGTKQDSLLQFSGTIPITASLSGIVNLVNVQQGAYVQEGSPLATIAQTSSLVFILSVPFEEEDIIKPNMLCQVMLSNGDTLQGKVSNSLPSVDVANQVENFVVNVKVQEVIPENLNAIIRIPIATNPKAQTLPKSSVLTNETQTDFWVMQLLNDSIAIKIPIEKGIETEQRVAIESPQFQAQDQFLLSGAYGLPDTAYVSVTSSGL